jgi:hypothetical protein
VAAPHPFGRPSAPSPGVDLLRWVAGLALVLGAMGGLEEALLGSPARAAALLLLSLAGGLWILRSYRTR